MKKMTEKEYDKMSFAAQFILVGVYPDLAKKSKFIDVRIQYYILNPEDIDFACDDNQQVKLAYGSIHGFTEADLTYLDPYVREAAEVYIEHTRERTFEDLIQDLSEEDKEILKKALEK